MFFRLIKHALQHFYRHLWLSLVTITLMTLSLISITFLIALNVLGDQALAQVKEKINLSIYLKPETTKVQVEEFRTEIEAFPQTQEVKYTSPEEALEVFRERHQDNPALIKSLEELDKNPLGGTFIIKANTLEDYSSLLTNLEKSSYNNLVQEKEKNYQEAQLFINKLSSFSNQTQQIGIIISLIFLAIAALVVFNTIQMATYTFRDEISIMRLVGASSFFIRTPFLLKGVFCAFLAWCLTISIFWFGLSFFQPYLQEFFGMTNFDLLRYFKTHFFSTFGLELGLLILLTLISGSLAMRKYLRV